MLDVREQVQLAGFTTLGLGGPARRFVTASTDAEIIAEVRGADERGEPVLVLGGGSNLVVSDEGFPGTVVQVATRGISRTMMPADGAEPGDGTGGGPTVAVKVAAGEDWDAVVASCVGADWPAWKACPGSRAGPGATPIQNVGAYGQEVAETITAIRAYDRVRAAVVDLAPADCGFGYRTSAFKRTAGTAVTGRFVVLAVTFGLARGPLSAPVRYAELARALGVAVGARAPLGAVRAAVLGLRRGKGMLLDPADPDSRSAGSFFTNPVLDAGQFAALQRAVAARCGPGPAIPQFPAGPGQVKVPAAWLISQAGFSKGYPGDHLSPGAARISGKHTLALVNPGDASTAGLIGLAREIRDQVRAMFGVDLASEPVLIGVTL